MSSKKHRFRVLLAAITIAGLCATAAAAQSVMPDPAPGFATTLPQQPEEPVQAAKRLEQRKDVANVKLAPLAQAVKETKRPSVDPAKPGAAKPAGPTPSPHQPQS